MYMFPKQWKKYFDKLLIENIHVALAAAVVIVIVSERLRLERSGDDVCLVTVVLLSTKCCGVFREGSSRMWSHTMWSGANLVLPSGTVWGTDCWRPTGPKNLLCEETFTGAGIKSVHVRSVAHRSLYSGATLKKKKRIFRLLHFLCTHKLKPAEIKVQNDSPRDPYLVHINYTAMNHVKWCWVWTGI